MQALIAPLKKLPKIENKSSLIIGALQKTKIQYAGVQNVMCCVELCIALTIYNTAILFYHSYACVYHTVIYTSAFIGCRSVYIVQNRYRLK